MDSVVKGIPRAAAYLDDVLVGGTNFVGCRNNLDKILSGVEEYNIKINVYKCNLFKRVH